MTRKRESTPANDNEAVREKEAAGDSARAERGEPEEAPEKAPATGSAAGEAPGREGEEAGKGETEPAARDFEAELADLKDRLLRALAETENTRRRGEREREQAEKFAIAAFAREMVAVADNLRRALDAVPAEALQTDEAVKALAHGVELTERELLAVFERNQIRKIEPLGERFDPALHHAVFESTASDEPPGTVVAVLQPGYVLNGRLLRPAMVGVAKGEGDGGEGPPEHGDTLV